MVYIISCSLFEVFFWLLSNYQKGSADMYKRSKTELNCFMERKNKQSGCGCWVFFWAVCACKWKKSRIYAIVPSKKPRLSILLFFAVPRCSSALTAELLWWVLRPSIHTHTHRERQTHTYLCSPPICFRTLVLLLGPLVVAWSLPSCCSVVQSAPPFPPPLL